MKLYTKLKKIFSKNFIYQIKILIINKRKANNF